MCFPHEFFDYDRYDYAGVLLSLEIAGEVTKLQKQHAKSNKSKIQERSSRAPRRPTRSRSNPKRPTRG